MLRIYPVLLELITTLQPTIALIARRDPDLARQLRRCLASAPLNVAEGAYSRGRNRQARYHNALGSAREALSCLEVAAAAGYVPAIAPAVREKFDHVIGVLVSVVRW